MTGQTTRLGLALAMFVLAAFGDVAGAAVTVSKFTPVVGVGVERGVTRVVCEQPDSPLSVRVRAVVLDIGVTDPKHDVLLAPAHVLPEDERRIKKDCRVFDGDGSPVRIARFWLSQSSERRMRGDWVVLVTRSGLRESIGRLRAGAMSQEVLERLIEEKKPVAVMLATSAADQHDCRILDLKELSVFSHSCRGWAGLSGSPIVVGLDGEPVVIGMNIAMTMRPLDMRGPLFLGVGLAIDDAIAAAIREAASPARRRAFGRAGADR